MMSVEEFALQVLGIRLTHQQVEIIEAIERAERGGLVIVSASRIGKRTIDQVVQARRSLRNEDTT